jgi:6-phosphogluconolactonase
MSRARLHRLADARAVAVAAAQRFQTLAAEAVRLRGRFVVALAGGSTPRTLYELLGSEGGAVLPWHCTSIAFGDERCVPPDHPDSNYRLVRETLLRGIEISSDQVLRVPVERPPREAAALYERVLRSLFPGSSLPRFDLVLLGLGEDGHTASLFPDTPALEETTRWVVANQAPRLGSWRITLTLPAICAARHAAFLVTGSAKARAVAEVFGPMPHTPPLPAELVAPRRGQVEVFLDEPSATRLL